MRRSILNAVAALCLLFSSNFLGNHLYQPRLGNLAKTRQRELRQNLKTLRKFILSNLLAEKECFQLIKVPGRSVAQEDAGTHALTEVGVSHGNTSHVLYRRMGQNDVLDLFRADLFPAPVDKVLLATLDYVVA